jgi:hypothetical protein
MFRVNRRTRLSATLPAVAAAAVAGLVAAAPAAEAAAHGHPAGVVGKPITLANHIVAFSGYDVATNSAGTAYIGWISTTTTDTARTVNLCRLPVGATSCTGGVQTIDSLDPPSASGLQVVVTGHNLVHLIWFHDSANSLNGPQNSALAEATAQDGKNLTAGHDVVTDAPSFGALFAAVPGPHGSIWTVTYAGLPTRSVQVRDGLSAARVSVHTPYDVGYAQLAFTGGKAVLAVEKYGSIGTPPHYASRSSGGSWGSFHPVAHTWALGTNAALATSRHGLRIVTEVNNGSYRPVIARWTGHGFAARHLTADHNPCAPSSHDGVADPSGRLLDASWECGVVTVTNYADAAHAAIVRLPTHKTATATPQIGSGTRGIATVAYSTENSDQTLYAAHIRLPGSTHTVRHSGSAGRVTVTGPRSCLPAVNVHIGWTHHAASGWSFKSGSLRLNGKHVNPPTLDGATLTAGKTYTLTGKATFTKSGNHHTVKTTLNFTTCASG